MCRLYEFPLQTAYDLTFMLHVHDFFNLNLLLRHSAATYKTAVFNFSINNKIIGKALMTALHASRREDNHFNVVKTLPATGARSLPKLEYTSWRTRSIKNIGK